MHSKIVALFSLCAAASILQAADAGASPVGVSPRRHLGSREDYGHHPRHHDHDHDHDHDHGKNHRHHDDKHPSHYYYRRRLEDAKATESKDYKDDHGKDDYDYGKDRKDRKDGYEHKRYGGHDDYDDDKGYGYKSYGGDCDEAYYGKDYYGKDD
ncbi:hypothetical protein PHYSODRAFT_323477 [Phytophthora sojae]|uniref:M96 mating-specific protein n=1 Tax=Phytophthora sojae (strain P6497) TaxID=1094619 RepID=G4YN69_PHYSP|nr:hypothetical protein PHYSODRAFT_323477 [Phytophthora sojae]EGZ30022.1 hypothetical protein PHYSODRAFT_323477 [Phytophthora sojae]|eukprot:XP_009517297.1 hypothetical protein PHYSODRAFT_323477 [Phytophthora sojae]